MRLSPRTALLVFPLGVAVCLGAVIAFNLRVDPYCFGCAEVDPRRRTLNAYYETAQNIVSFPETRQIVVGTSRGMAFPVDWLEERSGLRTLNLSVGGAEMFTKIAFVRIARERLSLASVLWVADYFEVLGGLRNQRFLGSPALRRYVAADLPESAALGGLLRFSSFFDHNTLEASFALRKRSPAFEPSRGGPGPAECRPRAPEPMTESLERQVNTAWLTYTGGALKHPEVEAAWAVLERELAELRRRGTRVRILVPPYHPHFRERLHREQPALYEAHGSWIRRLRQLAGGTTTVVSFFDGLPDDGPGPQNWRDGDHFTCPAAVEMLKRSGI